MTPSEKAIELLDWFMPHMPPTTSKLSHAKQCAVKVCEEVINNGPTRIIQTGIMIYDVEYWNQVIDEIKALR